MNQDNAQSKAQSAWGVEEHGNQGQDQPNSKAGVAAVSNLNESICERIFRAIREGKANGITGGILARMISDKQDRIREAEECIEWYERERQKRSGELMELQQLVESLLQDQGDEPKTE
jgi:hypothetical protein